MISRMFRALLLLGLLTGLVFTGCDNPTDPIEQVSKPIFNPAGGTYQGLIEVGITTATLGTTIQYTTDGTTPNSNSSVYSEPILINSTTTLKAKAFRSGMKDSANASATYTITSPPMPESFVPVEGGTVAGITVSSFYIDKYELTQAGYQTVMGSDPASGYGDGDTYPVYHVSWFNAIEYSNRRSLQEGLMPCYSYLSYGTNPDNWPGGWNSNDNNAVNVSCSWTAGGYRLPSEAEWEYAARGGLQTHGYTYSGSNDLNAVGWYWDNWGASAYSTHSVGALASNELGIYDLSGNVWEWCWDVYSGSYRVLRGGSWGDNAAYCTVSSRNGSNATSTSYLIGFRCVRVSP